MCACGAAWMIGSAKPEAPCQAELPAAGPAKRDAGVGVCETATCRAPQAGRALAAAPFAALRTQLCW